MKNLISERERCFSPYDRPIVDSGSVVAQDRDRQQLSLFSLFLLCFRTMTHPFVARSSMGRGANPVSQARGLSGMDPGVGGRSVVQDRVSSSDIQSRSLSGLGPGFGGSSSVRHRVGSSGRRRVDGPVDHPPKRPRHGPSGVQSRAFSPGPGVCKKAGGDCVPRSDSFPPLDRDPGNARLSRQVSKAITCFARYPDTRPIVLCCAADGSLDIHQV